MVEAERMSFVRKQQKDLRSETYSKLASLAQDPESGVTLRGKKVVLPSSFTGSPRYMMQNYLDAMTVCKFYGYPDLFITFTCNPNWPEIAREVSKKGLKPEDRPDVITRVFKIKLDSLIKEFKDERTFGRVRGVVYTIEFQKRGLPHCHILLWLEEEDKLTTPSHIDKYISAEIPDKEEDPELYQIVKDHMMHGPCGPENPSCPCTVDFKCTKKFPKQFNESTFIDESGYAIYRRRNDGNSIKKNGSDLHNGYVVPYNPGLLRRYQSHINVEWCNQIGSIKYLFKYINKGPDRVTVAVDVEEVDEVQDYYDCRYLSACEAAWRIYGFDIHYRTPSVNETKFEAWMELNKTDTFAQTLLYVEIPKYYVWNQQDRIWQPRQRGLELSDTQRMNQMSQFTSGRPKDCSFTRFVAIPINVVEDSMCHIAADSELADLIRKAKLIIWDEAPMINQHCYEAFDRTLKYICRSDRSTASKQVFGGKVVLFGESDDHVGLIIHETYPHLLQNLWNPEYFQERAILAPTHEMVDMINKRMLSLTPGDEKIYESSDSVFCSLPPPDVTLKIGRNYDRAGSQTGWYNLLYSAYVITPSDTQILSN
ncbi:ATP-dependent DNA helicase PIF1-like protein [Tanacetum coccineum]